MLPFAPDFDWDTIYELSRRIAEAVVQREPSWFTLDFAKRSRAKKILVDYKRNHRGAVAVAAYSTRARPHGPLSIPFAWHELKPTLDPERWTVSNVRERLGKPHSDPWKDFWTEQQTLRR